MVLIAVGATVFFVLSSHWWLLYGRSVRGTVLDASNSQPIPNAMVVVKWIGSLSGVHGPTYLCYHVALTTTGPDGTFYVPFWWQQTYAGANPVWLQGIWTASMDKPVHVAAYRPGYVVKLWPQSFATGESVVMNMEPVVGTKLERLSYLVGMFDRQMMCDADEKSLIPLHLAAYDGGSAHWRHPPEELKMVDTLAHRAGGRTVRQ